MSTSLVGVTLGSRRRNTCRLHRALDEAVGSLVTEVHRDTVDRLRRLRDEAAVIPIDDRRRLSALATEQALEIGAADFQWLQRFDVLWDHLSQRGAALLAGRSSG